MSIAQLKPMGIGRMLDYCFQLYRRNFGKLYLVTLMFIGPIYLLMLLLVPGLFSQEAANFQTLFDSFGGSGEQWSSSLQDDLTDVNAETVVSTAKILLLLIVFILYFVCMMPVLVASTIFNVKKVYDGDSAASIGKAIKEAFRRFGALMGSSLLFGVIAYGILVLTLIATTLGVAGIAAVAAIGNSLEWVAIVVAVVGIPGMIVLYSFFLTRWMYFLPVVALREQSVGLARSWALTRGSFWRLFGTYLAIGVIVYIFSFIVQFAVYFVIGMNLIPGLLGQLLSMVLMLAVYPLMMVLYAVSFFDLKVRREGYGLEAMIRQTVGEQSGNVLPI